MQLAVLVAMLLIAGRPWFLLHDQYPGMWQSGYSLRVPHIDCDIVLYGDSSALTGLDPQIVEQITGLKACNISEGTTIQWVVGSDFPLQHYLAVNKRPRYLLAMYTPSIFTPTAKPFAAYYPEGILYGLQYDHSKAFAIGLLKHPHYALKFSIWAGHALLEDVLLKATHRSKPWVDTRTQRDSRNGIWPYPLPAETHCVREDASVDLHLLQGDQAGVDAFRSAYGKDGTTVLVDVDPIPPCEALQGVYRRRLAGMYDNTMDVVPIRYFNEGDVHFSPEGSRYISTRVGQQIKALMEKEVPRQEDRRLP